MKITVPLSPDLLATEFLDNLLVSDGVSAE